MKHSTWPGWFLLTVAAGSLLSCGGSASPAESVVAHVGVDEITADEFRIAYELASPSKFPITDDPLVRKGYLLDRMVETKLLALAGQSGGFDTTRIAQRVLEWERRQALIRALYRTNVEEKIEITEDDLRDGFIKSGQVLELRQILLSDWDEANATYERIRSGESFESIAIEKAPPGVPPERVLEPRSFNWGDLEERLEFTAFGLNHLEVSAPVPTRSGFHILQLVNRRQNLLQTESAFQSRRSYVETMIRRQRGAAASEEYLKELASGKTATLRSETVVQLAVATRGILAGNPTEVPVPAPLQVREIEGQLGDLDQKPIADFGTERWTVEEVVARIVAMPPEERPDLTVPASIAKTIAKLIRDDYLVLEAERQGLDDAPTVVEDVARVREELSARLKRAELYQDIKLTDADVQRFYADNAARYTIPERVSVREVMVRRESLADSVLADALAGADLEALARKFSVRTWAADRGGDLGPITKDAFGSVGTAAFAATVGELVGPVPVLVDSIAVGYSVLQVTERIPAELQSFESIGDRVGRDALQAAQEDAIASFVLDAAARWPVSKNVDALASIRTTDETATGRPMDMVLVRRAN